MAAGSKFQTGTAYKAEFVLTAASGWTFAGIDDSSAGPDVFTYTGTGVTITHGAGAASMPLTVELVFPAVVNIFNLTPYLPAPVRGVDSEDLTPTAQYTGTVAWSKVTGGTLNIGDPFEAETEYKAVLTLDAKEGYVFGVGTNAFTHSKAAAGYPQNDAGSGDEVEITIFFPKTEKEGINIDLPWAW
jgi:hypothetical protein